MLQHQIIIPFSLYNVINMPSRDCIINQLIIGGTPACVFLKHFLVQNVTNDFGKHILVGREKFYAMG